jgi:hypothetical protein
MDFIEHPVGGSGVSQLTALQENLGRYQTRFPIQETHRGSL